MFEPHVDFVNIVHNKGIHYSTSTVILLFFFTMTYYNSLRVNEEVSREETEEREKLKMSQCRKKHGHSKGVNDSRLKENENEMMKDEKAKKQESHSEQVQESDEMQD